MSYSTSSQQRIAAIYEHLFSHSMTQFLHNQQTYFESVNSFGKTDLSAAFPVVFDSDQKYEVFDLENYGSSVPEVVVPKQHINFFFKFFFVITKSRPMPIDYDFSTLRAKPPRILTQWDVALESSDNIYTWSILVNRIFVLFARKKWHCTCLAIRCLMTS